MAIERVDRLVQTLGAQRGMRSGAIDGIVARVDEWLEVNRRKAEAITSSGTPE